VGNRDTAYGRLSLQPGAAAIAAARALRNPVPVDTTQGVFTRVAAIASAEPDRTAVLATAGPVSYGALLRRSLQIGAVLQAAQCGAGDRVAVGMPRSADTIATFLAIESIGAVYVPVDPDWPVGRVAAMLAKVRPGCLVTPDVADSGATPAGRAAAEVGIARVWPDPGAAPAAPPEPRRISHDESRYLIHTSGSTGRPKGAVVLQGGLLNHLQAMVSSLDLTATDTVAFSAPPAYVISVWQMLAALLVGARVAVIDDADLRFPTRLAGVIAREAITVVELVPTAIGWIVDVGGHADLSRVRCLISTGEKLDPGLARRVVAVLPHLTFMNAYGSTECSDDVALHVITAADTHRPRIAAGRPIANAVMYLLVNDDGQWRAAVDDEEGELWIGGYPVGGGYYDEPELTRAAFFVDEISPDSPTGRLYRTGDLAVFSDGLVYCRGRADRQVKIAGVRVELDEIEAVLSRVPGVVRSAVVLDHDLGRTNLAVYYMAQPGTRQEDLYGSLRAALPAAMFPRQWTRVDELPLNGSGKVDYKALALLRNDTALASSRISS
jgi:amino acid adenylation domain-containing protein